MVATKINEIAEKNLNFEKLCVEIFEKLGFEVIYNGNDKKHFYDFELNIGGKIYYAEVTLTSSIEGSKLKISRVIERLKNNLDKNKTNRQISNILVLTPCLISDELYKSKYRNENVYIFDLSSILFLIKNDGLLLKKFEKMLPFSISNIDLNDYSTCIVNEVVGNKTISFSEFNYDSVIEKLNNWEYKSINNKKESSKYERLCTEVLSALFSTNLDLWRKQQNSFNDLYRFDLVCRIKDNINSGFWNLIETHFKSKYIIFECKNYKEKITQKEIYTTERYLYLKALRSVAIIISNEGINKNADIARKGCLRENGKLIISLTNNDLIKMLELKKEDEEASEKYLYKVLDELLLTLEK